MDGPKLCCPGDPGVARRVESRAATKGRNVAFFAWFRYVRFRLALSVAPYGVAASNPKDLGMVAPLSELCQPQAALEAAT